MSSSAQALPRPDRVFVYGTLRAGQSNAHWLAGATPLGAARTPATYALFDTGPYPAAVACGDTALIGEVYRIDAPCLAALDQLEGYPAYYTRKVKNTSLGSAWIYLWAAARPAHWPRIADGDWVAHRRRLS